MMLKRLIQNLLFLDKHYRFPLVQITDDQNLIRLQYKDTPPPRDLAVGLLAIPYPLDYDQDGDSRFWLFRVTDVPLNGTFLF